jgi:hypothetical protein
MTSDDTPGGSKVLAAEWPFPTAAALGSAVRAEGIEREIKARLAFPDRKRLAVDKERIELRIPAGDTDRFAAACRIVSQVLDGIGALPVLPGEAEDILAISARERLKWTKDGRLQSAGTRTVKLRGRARTVTFHVFDPRHVEDVLDRDLPAVWREEDARATAEARRRAAGKAALTRRAGPDGAKAKPRSGASKPSREAEPALEGWSAFDAEGLLR